jgi:WbqC-like protein family
VDAVVTTVTAFQPQPFPRLHLLNRLAASDVAVLMESAQFVPKNAEGFLGQQHFWMGSARGQVAHVLPVAKGPRARAIKDVPLAAGDWRGKLVKRLAADYAKAPRREAMLEEVYYLLAMEDLSGLGAVSTVRAAQLLGVKTVIVPDAETGGRTAAKGEWILDICQSLGATRYLCGQPSLDYLDVEAFRGHGIEVVAQDWAAPAYEQVWPVPLTNLSYLDALAHGVRPDVTG